MTRIAQSSWQAELSRVRSLAGQYNNPATSGGYYSTRDFSLQNGFRLDVMTA